MILILSYDQYEQGTDPVIDWLLYYRKDFLRVSLSDIVRRKVRYQVDLQRQDILINGQSIKEKIKVIWHRRLMGESLTACFNQADLQQNQLYQLKAEVNQEISDLVQYLGVLFKDKKWLTSFEGFKVNKLWMLNLASQSGLSVPRSEVINNRRNLRMFYSRVGKSMISKPISDSREAYAKGDKTYLLFTNEMSEERIATLPDFFFPTLFQEKINIDFEIRTFYLDGKFSSTAVLNTSAKKEVDKKLYITSKNTHYVPYELPKEIEEKLHWTMMEAKLNTGCLDLMKDVNGNYIFIEVNPIGQYLAESERCNYHLDRFIAEWLIETDNT